MLIYQTNLEEFGKTAFSLDILEYQLLMHSGHFLSDFRKGAFGNYPIFSVLCSSGKMHCPKLGRWSIFMFVDNFVGFFSNITGILDA